MHAKETTLQELIGGSKQFTIPLYQRPYSWGDQQLRKLWDDIVEQAELVDAGVVSTHFIGSIVLAPSPDIGAVGVQRWVVVDGQQRLTTLMLLLCALRDHLAIGNSHAVDKYNDLYLTNKWESGDAHFRLWPTQADREPFAACISATSDAGGSDRIGAAYRFFRRQLVATADPADPHDLSGIESVIVKRLVLVVITASKDDNVYRIFESLNNTGLRLSQADLIRNYLFMCLPTQGDHVYVSHWLPMQKLLTAQQLELLMYLDLVMRGDERVRRDDLYSSHQERIKALSSDEEAVVAYLAQLTRRATLLRLLVDPATEADKDLRAAIESLTRWGSQVTYPALMALLEAREHARASSAEVASAIGYIEGFLVRRMLAGIPSNNLNRIFQSLVSELARAHENLDALTRRVLSGTRNYWPTDAELADAIATRNFYWSGRHEQRMFVLRRLELSYPSSERANLDAPEITIEHVMPQTLTDDWLKEVAAGTEPGEDPVEIAHRLMHTLGNLTLTGYNPKLSNSTFDNKRALLATSNLEMNRPIAAERRWGPTQIQTRAIELSQRAAALWPGPDETVRGTPKKRQWELLHEALAACPSGAWTAYSDLAQLVGSHPMPVAGHVANDPTCPNGHRVLTAEGKIADGFRWSDPTDLRDVKCVLAEEGVLFDDNGRADPAQRLSAQDLAALIGLDDDGLTSEPPGDRDPALEQERHETFFEQLARRSGPAVAGAVTKLLEHWVSEGGRVSYGTARSVTSCFLRCSGPTGDLWPFTVYPGSTAEVCFQWLKSRPPFDDPALRDQFRQRLNGAVDIEIPSSKLDLRPSIPLDVIVNDDTRNVVADALSWFLRVVEESTRASMELPSTSLRR